MSDIAAEKLVSDIAAEKLIPDAENALAHATDNLIGLYRSLERKALDLPPFSIRPFFIFFWAVLKFWFFFYVGVFLIVPTNLVILVRNIFPGRHWRYRPFFLRQLYYMWLWVWRGEVPTAPFIFVRPLLNVFMKGHFERRLRRLRLEMLFRDELSDSARSALLARVDAALERWKSPRFTTFFFSLLLPALASFVSLYKQVVDFLESIKIHIPTLDVVVSFLSENVVRFISENMSETSLRFVGATALGYLLTIPLTAFLAKRGLFLGADVNRIYFPGEQGGSGVYSKEREILASVGLRIRETPIDFWLFGFTFVISYLLLVLNWAEWVAWMRANTNVQWDPENQLFIQLIAQAIIFFSLLFIAVLRRGTTQRA